MRHVVVPNTFRRRRRRRRWRGDCHRFFIAFPLIRSFIFQLLDCILARTIYLASVDPYLVICVVRPACIDYRRRRLLPLGSCDYFVRVNRRLHERKFVSRYRTTDIFCARIPRNNARVPRVSCIIFVAAILQWAKRFRSLLPQKNPVNRGRNNMAAKANNRGRKRFINMDPPEFNEHEFFSMRYQVRWARDCPRHHICSKYFNNIKMTLLR